MAEQDFEKIPEKNYFKLGFSLYHVFDGGKLRNNDEERKYFKKKIFLFNKPFLSKCEGAEKACGSKPFCLFFRFGIRMGILSSMCNKTH